jgi:ATP-dependent DNA helicase RecG
MLLTEAEFQGAFPDEGSHVEFKEGVSPSRVQEAVTAFSNTEGGVVLVGVRNSGSVVGVYQPGEKMRLLHEAVSHVHNPGRYDIREIAVGSRPVLALSVARRHEGFAQTSDGRLLVRRGASNQALVGTDLSRFLARRAFQSFETTPVEPSLADADAKLVERLRAAYGWSADQLPLRLHEIGYLANEGGEERLTVAGALLLLTDPSRIGTRAFIDIRRIPDEGSEPDRTWRVEGSAAEQIERATQNILDELGSISVVLGVQRVDIPKLPPLALREVIANAVAHRSYEAAGSAVRVEIRPDRVRVTSPGSLPEPVTIMSIRDQQSARNEHLLEALCRMGLAEDRGLGIDRIEDDMQADLLQPPEFDDDGSFFTVTLRLAGAITATERAWVRGLIDREVLDPRSAPIVVQAARKGSITNSEVRSLLRVDSTQARALLQRLVRESILVQQGDRGGAQYVVSPSMGMPARIRYSEAELEEAVLALADSGPITNALVRDRTGLDRLAALALMRRLVQEGKLVQEGQRRGTRYVRSQR